MTLPTDWQDNIGQVVDADYLNTLDTLVNSLINVNLDGGTPSNPNATAYDGGTP